MSDKDAILARTREMYAAFGSGDVPSAVGVYTENAIVYQNGRPPLVGKSAIQANMEMFAMAFKSIELESVEFFEQLNDNTAYTLFISKCEDKSGKVGKLKGSVLWRKIGGVWYTEHDVFNECPV